MVHFARWVVPVAASFCALLVSPLAVSGEQICFLPQDDPDEDPSIAPDPASKVCRAFQRELNANCAGDIPTVEFIPRLPDSGLTVPAWQPIQLFDAKGAEDPAGFALLEKLVRAYAFTQYFRDKEERAERDAKRILGLVRAAHSAGSVPRLEQVSIDLEGRGKKEILYRLYSGGVRNAKSLNDENSGFKREPYLYLERSVRLTSTGVDSKASPGAAGAHLTAIADVLLFDGDPYFLSWTGGNSVLIDAAYSQKSRPLIPDEELEGMTYIIPTMRCVFESRPTH